MSVLLLLGVAQGAFFSLVLATTKKNRVANTFLALLLLVFIIGLVEGFMSITYLYLKVPYLIGLEWPMLFMYGPLVYFYVKSLTEPEWRIQYVKLSVHFLPVAITYIYLIPFFMLNPGTKGRVWFYEHSMMRNGLRIIDPIQVVVVIQLTGYLVLSLRLLKKHSRNIRENFSSIENINLSWLKTLIFICFYLMCTYIFFTFFSQFYGLYKQTEYLLNLMIAVIIYIMAYKGMRQPEIFSQSEMRTSCHGIIPSINYDDSSIKAPDSRFKINDDEAGEFTPAHVGKSESIPDSPEPEAENRNAEKYKRSSLTDDQSGKILARVTQLMLKDRPYLETGLTLPMLASMLNVSPNHLSQVINGKLNKSFFDFVNEYRVEKAKKALISPESDRFSILGIALDAGFNSKSSFYTAFKKHTGMTPSQFKERLLSPDHSE